MEGLINSIGGYDGWQFTSLAFGVLFIGLALRIKWTFMIPIPFAGLGMCYLLLNYAVTTSAPNIVDPVTSGLASILPILFVAVGIFVIVDPPVVARMFEIHTQDNKTK